MLTFVDLQKVSNADKNVRLENARINYKGKWLVLKFHRTNKLVKINGYKKKQES